MFKTPSLPNTLNKGNFKELSVIDTLIPQSFDHVQRQHIYNCWLLQVYQMETWSWLQHCPHHLFHQSKFWEDLKKTENEFGYLRKHCNCIDPDFSGEFSKNPCHDINVMDAAVVEDSTRCFQIRYWWKRRVSADNLNLLNLSKLSFNYKLLQKNMYCYCRRIDKWINRSIYRLTTDQTLLQWNRPDLTFSKASLKDASNLLLKAQNKVLSTESAVS